MRGLGRQGLLNASATIVPGIYSVLAIGAILHTLGAESYAAWATAVVLLGWVNLLDLGLAQTVVRASARAMLGDEAGVRDVREATAVYAVLGVIAALVGFVMAYMIPVVLSIPPPQSRAAIQVGAILALDAAIVLATAPWSGILRGTGRFGQLLGTSIAQVAASLPVLLILLPSIGLPGAAIAQLAGRLASRSLMVWLLHGAVPWFRLRPGQPSRSGILRVARFLGSDLPDPGCVSDRDRDGHPDRRNHDGAAAAGLYAAGAQLVRYLAYFLFPVIDVVYPRLSSIEYAQPRLAAPVLIRSLFLAATVGTVAFGGLALEGVGALTLWSGQSAGLSVLVLVLYAITYVIITPAHILVIALIARGRHRTVALVILAEAIVNLGLSIALTLALGPVGPAVSTLIVVSVDDLLVIPWLASRQLGVSLYRIALAGFGGVAVAIAILAASRVIGGEGTVAMLARGSIATALLGGVLAVGFRRAIGPTEGIVPRRHNESEIVPADRLPGSGA